MVLFPQGAARDYGQASNTPLGKAILQPAGFEGRQTFKLFTRPFDKTAGPNPFSRGGALSRQTILQIQYV